jgi:uncharacterized protein (TIGR03000 family)
MRSLRLWLLAVTILFLAAAATHAQMFRRPIVPMRPLVPARPIGPYRPLPYIDTSWQNNPYVYWMIHHHRPYPPPYPYPYPVPYPVPMGPGYTVVNNYYTPSEDASQAAEQTTAVLPPPKSNQGVVAIKLPTTAAVVWIDGNEIDSGLSATRVYTTPDLEPGHDYSYTVKAQWVRLGDNVTQERHVSVAAGKTTVVDFTKKE